MKAAFQVKGSRHAQRGSVPQRSREARHQVVPARAAAPDRQAERLHAVQRPSQPNLPAFAWCTASAWLTTV